jgi:hypothetical protein
MDYRIQQTVSQNWPRHGPNRWEVIIIARLGSPADEKSVKKRIMAFFGESIDRDVPVDHWAAGAVANLRKVGILTGYPDGSFDGAGTIKLR